MHVIVLDVIILILVLLLPARLINLFLIRDTRTHSDASIKADDTSKFWFIATCAIWDMAATDQLWYLIHHRRGALVRMVKRKKMDSTYAIWHCSLVSLIALTFIEKRGNNDRRFHQLRLVQLKLTVSVSFK